MPLQCRPCCPANFFLGSPTEKPSPPPADATACVLHLTGHGLRCLQRFHEKQSLCTTTLESEDYKIQPGLYQEVALDEGSAKFCLGWSWLGFDETGLRRLSSTGGSNAMQGAEVFESVGLAEEEEAKPRGKGIENLLSENNVAKQSGVQHVVWKNHVQGWCVQFRTAPQCRLFSVKKFLGPGISLAQADVAALEAAKAFRAELVEKGILSEPKRQDPNFTSEVPGVVWGQAVACSDRVRFKDHSEAELERSFQVAVAWKKKQEKEKEGKAETRASKYFSIRGRFCGSLPKVQSLLSLCTVGPQLGPSWACAWFLDVPSRAPTWADFNIGNAVASNGVSAKALDSSLILKLVL
eukprot:s5489_g4.t1